MLIGEHKVFWMGRGVGGAGGGQQIKMATGKSKAWGG